jgi:competence protein ComEC
MAAPPVGGPTRRVSPTFSRGASVAWGAPVIDPVLLVALGLAAAAAVAGSPLAGALGVAGVVVALRGRVRPAAIAIAIAGVGLGVVRARAAIASAVGAHEASIAALTPPARCEGAARVVGSPVVVGARGAEARAARVVLEFERPRCGDRALPGPLRARLFGADPGLVRGDELDLVADVAPVHLFLNEGASGALEAVARSGVAASGGLVEARLVARGRGPGALVDRARAAVRARIEATFDPDAEPMARALVLGEADLAPEDDEAFRASGLAHLLAVSGTHLVIAVAGFAAALRALLVRVPAIAARVEVGRIAAAIAIPAAWLYADFAGGSGSAVRAAAMMTATLLARALGRRTTGPRAFGLALGGAALADPLLATDASFALSTAATGGLLALGGPLARALERGPRAIHPIGRAIGTTLAATLGSAPLLGLMAPTLPALGVAANLVAAPIGELFALPICLAHAIAAPSPAVERGLAVVGSGALLAVRAVARITTATGTAFAVPRPTPFELAALAVGLAAVVAAPRPRARLAAAAATLAALLALEIGAIRAGAPRGELRLTVVDVGQGDATLVDLPDGRAMLVDGGGFVGSPIDPGTRVLLPLLRARRRSRLEVVVLTHPHPDHFGGLATALPRLDVGEFWDSEKGEEEGAGATYAGLLAGLRARGVPVRRPSELCGAPRDLGGARVEVLAPCPRAPPGASANDASIVLRIAYGRRAALLVGDAEHEAEARLVASGRALGADLLKVGHHGSRTSTGDAFLAAVSPSIATISSGVRNRFGHPTAEVLARLRARSVPALRTDRGGAIVWSTDGERVRVLRPEAP